jgi:hypothetical protein
MALSDTPHSLAEAIGVLAREKSSAEQYAVILATVGKKDVNIYLRGVTLYAEAKAEFDGLVEQIEFSLRDGRDPTTSDAFTQTLEKAAQKRIAFTDYVLKDVVGKAEGVRPGLRSIVSIVPDLIKAITDAGLAIWREFRAVGKEKQDAILAELAALKWRPFAELAAG